MTDPTDQYPQDTSLRPDRIRAFFALVPDPASGLIFELGKSDDSEVHFRHLGFRTDDVDSAHETLLEAGMEAGESPHRRDFARMYTAFLKQPGGLEVQLVKYD